MRCKVCHEILTPDAGNAFDVHPDCMPVMRAQFYAELHRYRSTHHTGRIDVWKDTYNTLS